MKKYSFSDKALLRINEYINLVLSEISRDIDPVLIKDGIGRELDIQWENQTYYIDYIDKDDDRKWDVKPGETRFENVTSFFNSILIDEGINENVLFDLIVIERPKSGIAPNSAFDEYVSTTYIETTYRRIDRNIRSAFTRRALEESDMLAILNHLINM